MTDYGSIGGYGVALTAGGLLLAIGQMAWNRFFSPSGQAESTLYTGLKEQLEGCLTRIENLEGEIDDERRLRRMAQVRIAMLEQELAKHGIAIPPEASA